jgi:beta-phosphoglucomutase family hydrolase
VLGLPESIRAWLFDLDGVLTQTAVVHRSAWTEVFNAVLDEYGREERFTETDYLAHVDGKRRYDGTRDFLASRGIHPPEGDPSDPPTAETIAGIANRKNSRFNEVLQHQGVQVFDDAVRYLKEVRAAGLPTAVVTASANAPAVLAAASISDMFDTRIDGNVAARDHLKGKPAPDTFLAAARILGVEPESAAVFEDAISGVAAGRAGGFGVVVGVDRVGQAAALRENGADLVVNNLTELLESP